MQNILVDAGPIIALFDKNDQHHQKIIGFLKNYKGRLVSTWPVLTEAMHMLDYHSQVPLDVLEWVSNGGLELINLEEWQISRIRVLMEKYQDLPADMADLTLVVLSELLGIKDVLTMDSDFSIYQGRNGKLRRVLDYSK